MMKGGARLFLATSLCALTQAARSNETISYGYDSLGRLVRVERTGTVNNGINANYSYDAADNRTNVTVAAGSPAPSTPSPPPSTPSPPPSTPSPPPSTPSPPPSTPSPPPSTPSPPPGNQPPVAVSDSVEIQKCQYQTVVYVLDNDYDPDGNTPLTLTGVSYSGGLGTAFDSDPRIIFRTNGSTGSGTVTYTVSDSLGATATGTLTVNVVQGYCQ